ncbi:hypothetical protein [uncultured Desulfobacter sp.]|uniref:hypothetical protein n=1 Tax=uncultured Desulfobacter sp. TaxID=240139 RepID=UPI0029F53498|nr:hypothetical protein [uncultured Desulfobacter sp.]
MNNKKKSFFYWQEFRVMVFASASFYLWCFKFLSLFHPKPNEIINDYENGYSKSALIIGFTSALFFELGFILINFNSVVLNLETILMLLGLYFLFGCLGWLSLRKLHY